MIMEPLRRLIAEPALCMVSRHTARISLAQPSTAQPKQQLTPCHSPQDPQNGQLWQPCRVVLDC